MQKRGSDLRQTCERRRTNLLRLRTNLLRTNLF
uniref:Uncharacterized protein n=1 Tax=Cucumis melo TaxID=3656 RepID=A0A9I9E3N7_CUCME